MKNSFKKILKDDALFYFIGFVVFMIFVVIISFDIRQNSISDIDTIKDYIVTYDGCDKEITVESITYNRGKDSAIYELNDGSVITVNDSTAFWFCEDSVEIFTDFSIVLKE